MICYRNLSILKDWYWNEFDQNCYRNDGNNQKLKKSEIMKYTMFRLKFDLLESILQFHKKREKKQLLKKLLIAICILFILLVLKNNIDNNDNEKLS